MKVVNEVPNGVTPRAGCVCSEGWKCVCSRRISSTEHIPH